jgi:predicted PurR-regulated permease PerM
LALWVGLISQFIPVVGTYIAGVLPILITFIDSPLKALAVVIVIILFFYEGFVHHSKNIFCNSEMIY